MEQPVFEFDSLLQPEFARAPQPYYRQMRDTNPVMRLPDMYGSERSNVFVAKHSDIEYVLNNPALFSSDFLPPEVAPFPMIPENIDPPEHRKYRRLLDPLFGPKPVKRLEPDITRRANGLIDGFIERGECDFAQEFAVPLPCGVFLDLMGLPSDELDFFLAFEARLPPRPGGQQRVPASGQGTGATSGSAASSPNGVAIPATTSSPTSSTPRSMGSP